MRAKDSVFAVLIEPSEEVLLLLLLCVVLQSVPFDLTRCCCGGPVVACPKHTPPYLEGVLTGMLRDSMV